MREMKITNLQFSAPETDLKIMLVVSSIIMSVIWLAVAGLMFFVLTCRQQEGEKDWNGDEIKFVCGLAFVLVLIPIQLARYYREWRRL